MRRAAVARGSARDRRRHKGLLVGISCLLPIVCTCVCAQLQRNVLPALRGVMHQGAAPTAHMGPNVGGNAVSGGDSRGTHRFSILNRVKGRSVLASPW